ncbi:MAG: chloride channel protein [Ilumatobacteraceae bacterium]
MSWRPSRRALPAEIPGHERLVEFFGVRLRLVVAIVAAGVAGGGFGAAYLWTLDRVHDGVGPQHWSELGQIGVLVSAGLLVSVLVYALGHPADVELLVDNIHVPDAEHEHPARLRSLLPVSLLCIGVGGTLGPEAPVVTTTGTVGHRLAVRWGLEPDDVRVVAITGMAAGFAVLFGAPLGGALFALEIPHRRGIGYSEAAVPACIGAVLGYAFSTAAGRFGLAPIWELPLIDEIAWIDLVWAVVAGLLGAVIGLVFTGLVRAGTVAVRHLPAVSRPAIGGVALGLLAIASPYALTNGELQIDELAVGAAVSTLALAAIVKLTAAAVCVVTGWRGGFIIPLFFVGFCVGRVVVDLLPGATEWAFVVAVMIAANVSVTKTPLGSTLVVLEMAGATVLPGALVAALVSLVVTSPLAVIASQRDRVDAYGSDDDPI